METPSSDAAPWNPAAPPASDPGRFRYGDAFVVGRHNYYSRAGSKRGNCRCCELIVGDFVFLFCRRLIYIYYALLCVAVDKLLVSLVNR